MRGLLVALMLALPACSGAPGKHVKPTATDPCNEPAAAADAAQAGEQDQVIGTCPVGQEDLEESGEGTGTVTEKGE
jgi:hypothetical protein